MKSYFADDISIFLNSYINKTPNQTKIQKKRQNDEHFWRHDDVIISHLKVFTT